MWHSKRVMSTTYHIVMITRRRSIVVQSFVCVIKPVSYDQWIVIGNILYESCPEVLIVQHREALRLFSDESHAAIRLDVGKYCIQHVSKELQIIAYLFMLRVSHTIRLFARFIRHRGSVCPHNNTHIILCIIPTRLLINRRMYESRILAMTRVVQTRVHDF